MNHPTSCTDPACALPTYAAHLRDLQVSPAAMPTRAVNRTKGKPDEPLAVTHERQSRWDREDAAFETLCKGGAEPESLAAAPARLRELGG